MGNCISLRFIGLWPTNSISFLSFKVFKLKLAGKDRQRMTGFCSKEKKTHQKSYHEAFIGDHGVSTYCHLMN